MRASLTVIVFVLFIGAATVAHGKPEYLDVLVKSYPTYSAALSARSCANCHVSDSDFAKNPYGKQIAQQLLSADTKTLSQDIVHAVEALSSDPGDMSNLEKIRQGLAPGVLKNSGSPAKQSSAQAAREAKPLWPKNAYHPAIVHFPIALFLAALFLDLVGFVRNNPKFLIAGWYNLVLAAVSSLGAISTGFVAVFSMGLPLKGLIFNHLLLAAIATVIMWALVLLRARRHENMSPPLRAVYFVLALAGMILISYSAHLGGAYVYGD